MVVGGVALVLMSRGDDSSKRDQSAKSEQPARNAAKPEPPTGSESAPAEPTEPQKVLTASTCPADLSNCVVASGRVIYVEKVDPDGDGDAHFVTTSAESVTGPGITIFDVRTDLRPDPLPGVGDLVGGAGSVFRGSRGQKQVEAVEFHVAQ